MVDNSVSACMEQWVLMKIFVNEGINPRIFTEDFKRSTLLKCSATERHLNGINISKMTTLACFRPTDKSFYAEALQAFVTHQDKCINGAEECVKI